MADDDIDILTLLAHSTHIVTAFVGNNPMSAKELPDFIAQVHAQVESLCAEDEGLDRPDPAVPIAKSVTRNHIVCLEDGRKLKMLKRYLRTHYSMTPDEYRQRWGLPSDYPMVAPEYAERRSTFAKKIGLGKKQSEVPS